MDLSLRAKLVLFAVALIVLPGSVFAVIAFSGTRAAIEREVGIQLHQIAEQGASAVGAAIERTRRDAQSWASQDLMRDLTVGDLDKRVSRFLATIGANDAAYRAVLCLDRDGRVVAASSGEWLGRGLGDLGAVARREGRATIDGPRPAPGGGGRVLAIAVPLSDPDAAERRLGALVVLHDWGAIDSILADISGRLRQLGKRIEGFLIDTSGRVLTDSVGAGANDLHAAVRRETWSWPSSSGFGKRSLRVPQQGAMDVLTGTAAIDDPLLPWSVVFVEPAREALAQVSKVRNRWIAMMASILLVGFAAAILLARQVLRPLDEVTRATVNLASHLDRELPLLPVRSRSEVGQLAESFNKMAVELKRSQEETLHAAKFAFAGELAAMVAHEVRTPLSVMRSSAQMLAEPAASRDASENAELAATIVDEVDRIERVVSGLLELAHPLEKEPAATRLGELLKRAADFVSPRAEELGARIECRTDEDVAAWCDAEQIYQVVLNLLINSLHAVPPGGRIWLRTLAGDGEVGFEVGDEGPGMPAELRERVFLPFVSGRESGTGLGLAFVERVVRAHGGRVVLHSEPGEGTVFEIWLPSARGKKS